jgi:hypothetical protein
MKTSRHSDNQPTAENVQEAGRGSPLPRLVRLLRFIREVWQSPYDIEPIREAHRKASEQYVKAVAFYHQCEADQVNSFLAHNEASYAKGKRDALNELLHSLPNELGHARAQTE